MKRRVEKITGTPGQGTILGERLAWAMKKRGIGQSELARRVGTRQGTIQNLLSGASKRSTCTVELALALEISPTWLGTGLGPPSPWASTSHEARTIARRFDELTESQKQEVIGYMDYIVLRSDDTKGLPRLEAMIAELTKK